MVVGARWAGACNPCRYADLLGFSQTTDPRVYGEGPEKEKISSEQKFSENALL